LDGIVRWRFDDAAPCNHITRQSYVNAPTATTFREDCRPGGRLRRRVLLGWPPRRALPPRVGSVR
jgi:hypothetical protein